MCVHAPASCAGSFFVWMAIDLSLPPCTLQDCSFPAYFYTQPMATGPGFYDNLCPQSWQDGSAATFTLQDPHQQTFDCPGN
jgi:hypothetical protein